MPLSEAELAILVTGKDVSATRVLRGVTREADRFQTKLAGIGSKAGRNFARNLERTIVAGGAAGAGAIGYSVKVAGDFEAQLRTINTIARETPEGLDAIGDSIRKIARDTGTPLDELTAGYYDLLSAGIEAADAQNVLAASNRLAIGGLASTAETVDLLTTAINTYGGDASQAGAYADYFAKAVERGKVKASEIAGSFATVGPLAAASNIEITEVAAAYARLTAAGVPAGEAASQMRSAIVALTRTTAPLEKLQKQTGRNYLSIAGKKGLVFALEQMRIDAKKAGVPLIDLLGRVEGLNFTLLTTGANFDAYNADLASMGEAGGTAAEQAAERMQGFNFQADRLKANLKDAAITIGTELLPVFADLAEEGTDWITDHQPEIKQFAQDLARSIREAVTYAKELDWDGIAGALQAGAGGAKAILDAFMAMPPDMKGLLVGGFVANKVTGGAVTDLAGLGLKSVFDRLIQRGSSPANPLYVVPIGGGMGGGMVPAGGAAGAASLGLGVISAAGYLGIGYMIGEGIMQHFGGKLTPDEQAGGGRVVAELAGIKVLLGNSPAATAHALYDLQNQRQVFGPMKGPRSGGLSPDERQESAEMRRLQGETVRAIQGTTAGVVGAVRALDLSVTFRPVTQVSVRVPVNLSVTGGRARASYMYQAASRNSSGGPVAAEDLW